MKKVCFMILLLLECAVSVVFSAETRWTDWQTANKGNPGTAHGIIGLSTQNVSVDYSGEIAFAQVSGGTNYWVPSAPYLSSVVLNPPATSDIIALAGGNSTVNTIKFAQPITNPVMAIASLGSAAAGIVARYQFDANFDILSQGAGYWGNGTLTKLSGNVLQGLEGHGVIQFQGTFTSISWTAPVYENWHGFTIGLVDITSTCGDMVTFTAGTPAKAAEVNANFDALNCQIQALKAIVCQDHPTASICQ